MVSTELSEAIIASLIIAMSAIAVAFAVVRRPSGDRTALWFGLFGCLYGVRLAGQSEFVQPLIPEVYWRYLDAFINYAIVIPAGLFIESVLGPGWRLTLRRAWQAVAIFASLAILHDVFRRQPGATLWLTPPVVLTAGFIAMAHVLAQWWRGSWPSEFRVAATGGLIFLGVAAYATLSEGAPPRSWQFSRPGPRGGAVESESVHPHFSSRGSRHAPNRQSSSVFFRG